MRHFCINILTYNYVFPILCRSMATEFFNNRTVSPKMNRHKNICRHIFKKIVCTFVKIIILSWVNNGKGNIKMSSLYFVYLFFIRCRYVAVKFFAFSMPNPIVKVTGMINFPSAVTIKATPQSFERSVSTVIPFISSFLSWEIKNIFS